MNWNDDPHRRFNPLLGEWVLVSPHRTKRPWQGKVETPAPENTPTHDPGCYLCPGNERAGGAVNPKYQGTFSFVNDFSALLADAPHDRFDDDGLLVAKGVSGICKVICFSPRHDLTLAKMSAEEIRPVVDLWVDEYTDLGSNPDIAYVQVFENRGAMMGSSNPHPHGQIWSSSIVPDIPAKKDARQREWYERRGTPLLVEYLDKELSSGERIVAENGSFVALVPFWAVWPFEVMILPRRQMTGIDLMTESERNDLAAMLRTVGVKYDNLFSTSFPYSMGIHQRPTTPGDHEHWQWHISYLPPLLRSATVKKFMVGFELLANPQRDITAEQAAARLRDLPDVRFSAPEAHS